MSPVGTIYSCQKRKCLERLLDNHQQITTHGNTTQTRRLADL